MKKKAVIVTGALGGIGSELCRTFEQSAFSVIAVDKRTGSTPATHFLHEDIKLCGESPEGLANLAVQIKSILTENDLELHGLINNAAVQILASCENLTHANWLETLQVNLLAPFFLAQSVLPELENVHGAIVNISSIHERLTKPKFIAYATAKAALSGLTRALAVDLGPRVRVNAICPAAIETSMLKAGFESNPAGYEALKNVHPVGRIGTPHEVARLCVYLVNEAPGFLTGATIGVDGGVAGRLHDPS